jgi:hypothetical protein
MASSRSSSILVVAVVLLAVLASGCAGAGAGWKPETSTALATWSGAPEGAGSEGTTKLLFCSVLFCCVVFSSLPFSMAVLAVSRLWILVTKKILVLEAGECGYYSAIKDWPWGSNVTAVSPNMFRGGAACGTCWDLKVEDGDETIRVVATDVCRGGPCAVADYHFELSGHAFGLLANRSSGHITVSYTRLVTITIHQTSVLLLGVVLSSISIHSFIPGSTASALFSPSTGSTAPRRQPISW